VCAVSSALYRLPLECNEAAYHSVLFKKFGKRWSPLDQPGKGKVVNPKTVSAKRYRGVESQHPQEGRGFLND